MALKSTLAFSLPILLIAISLTNLILFFTSIKALQNEQHEVNEAKKLVSSATLHDKDLITACVLELILIVGTIGLSLIKLWRLFRRNDETITEKGSNIPRRSTFLTVANFVLLPFALAVSIYYTYIILTRSAKITTNNPLLTDVINEAIILFNIKTKYRQFGNLKPIVPLNWVAFVVLILSVIVY